ncbi:MAG: exosortase/archaeosortase family protein [Pirellulales bacterium]
MSTAKPVPREPYRPAMPGRPLPAAAAQVAWNDPSQHAPLAMLGGLVLLLLLAYWDMLLLTSRVWKSSGLYSHGWIVPLCALGLLWLRWEPLGAVPRSERWIGFGLLSFGLVSRLAAAYWGMHPIDRLSFIPAIFGVFIMVGGLNVVRWAGPALGFLVFMFPLPTRVENLVLLRLQTLAAYCSTFLLQTLGLPAFRESRIINISGIPLAVADACSGLRMVTIFCALAVAMVFLIERPWWDKFIILLSAVPIALVVNIIRITATGLAYYWTGGNSKLVELMAHEGAGWLMMPLALGILWLELQILERITIPVEIKQFRPMGQARAGAVPVR